MPRPDLSTIPEWYHRYINQVEGNDPVAAMKEQTPVMLRIFNKLSVEKRNYRYAKNKWTIKEMLQHIIDAERVFAYRGLCIARKETASLPSFDENDYALQSKAKKRDWSDMMEELKTLRRSTEILFGSFDKEQMSTVGIANNNPVSVLALAFILTGHIYHHIDVIRERYLP
ncbi:MAG: DinB family protein [Bacteroidota bacterium]|nr:DinB family protein [Bacteroidota bacterium]